MYNVIKGIMTVENLWRESSQGCGLVSQPTEIAMRLYAVQNLQQKLTLEVLTLRKSCENYVLRLQPEDLKPSDLSNLQSEDNFDFDCTFKRFYHFRNWSSDGEIKPWRLQEWNSEWKIMDVQTTMKFVQNHDCFQTIFSKPRRSFKFIICIQRCSPNTYKLCVIRKGDLSAAFYMLLHV